MRDLAAFVTASTRAMLKALRDDEVEAVVVAVVRHKGEDVYAYAANTETASDVQADDVRAFAEYKRLMEAALDQLCRVVYAQQRRRH